MKLKGLLKEKVEKAETMEEKKNIIADAGIELDDEELSVVVGGIEPATSIFKDIKNIIQ